jgi:hypothetical protein
MQGYLNMGFSYEYIYQNQIYVGSDKSFVGAIPEHHDEVSTMNQLTAFSIEYGAFDFLRFDVMIPFIHREHAHIHHHQGEELWEYWNFTGIGDAILKADFSIMNDMDSPFNLNLFAGAELPTGETDIKNNEGEEAEVTIQPGSGSTDLILGVAFSKSLASLQTLSGNQYSSSLLLLVLTTN